MGRSASPSLRSAWRDSSGGWPSSRRPASSPESSGSTEEERCTATIRGTRTGSQARPQLPAVLLQMGRPLLDSDVAAMVDAVLGAGPRDDARAELRGGSPDLGFLVTPGPPARRLRGGDATDLTVTQGTPHAWLGLPLPLCASANPALYPSPPARTPRGSRCRSSSRSTRPGPARAALWARVEAADDDPGQRHRRQPRPRARPTGPSALEFATGAATLQPLEIAVARGRRGLALPARAGRGGRRRAAFWIAPGSYHVDGLVADARGGGPFPLAGFPTAAGFPWDEPAAAGAAGGLLPAALGGRASSPTWRRGSATSPPSRTRASARRHSARRTRRRAPSSSAR